MPTRFAKAGLLSASLLLVVLSSPAGAKPPELPRKADDTCRSAAGKLEQRTYAVADLVVPIEDSPRIIRVGEFHYSDTQDTPRARPKTQEEKLVRMITSTICPRSWSEKGGPGTIDYLPLDMALVINQTADVQDQIADLLAALRRAQDVQVALEVRIASVPENLCQRVGVDFSHGKTEAIQSPANLSALFKHLNIPFRSGCAKLNDRQAAALLEAIQGDPQTNVLQTPKVTAFNGQRISVEVMEKSHFAGMAVERQPNGEVIACPKAEPISTGLRFILQPVISADRRGVEMDVTISRTDFETISAGAQAPPSEGKCCEGQKSSPASERQVRLASRTVRRVSRLPDGGTLVLDNGTRVVEGRNEYGPPVLSRIPYVNRLFKNVGYTREIVHELVLVTPRIIVSAQEEVRSPAPSACPFLRAKQESPQAASAPVSACPATPLDNLAKLEKARTTYRCAQEMRRAGRTEQAARAFEEVRGLCPGSRLDHLASRHLEKLHGEQVARGAEEQEPASAVTAPKTKNTAAKEKKLATLLRRYHEACAEGRLADARKLASRALAIDPACFSTSDK
jgi:general secretion pathway protein D